MSPNIAKCPLSGEGDGQNHPEWRMWTVDQQHCFPREWLEMQTLESSLSMLDHRLHFNSIPRWYVCTQQFDEASLMAQWVKNPHSVHYLIWYQKKIRFDPWVGKIPWRRKWQTTPVFLPEKSQGQRSLEGSQRVGREWVTDTHNKSLFLLGCNICC